MRQNGFSPKARWDRQPGDINEYDPECLNERIEVFARFKDLKIYPQEFTWKNRTYKITKITYSWQERRGQAIIVYFSVNTDSGLYQISFDNTAFNWQIDKVIQ